MVPIIVAPNAVNPTDGEALVMTGLMHYRRNIDGAVYFVREIFFAHPCLATQGGLLRCESRRHGRAETVGEQQ